MKRIVIVLGMMAMACSSSSSTASEEDLVIETSAVTLAAGEEKYLCWDADVVEPFASSGLDVEMPSGVHHYQVTATTASGEAKQAYECSGGEGGRGAGLRMLGVGGPSTPGVHFPPGTGMPFEKGARLVLQLHILNSAGSPKEYPVARVHVRKVSGDVERVGVLLVNDATLDIKARSSGVTGGTDCTPPEKLENVFAIWPHMHLLGTHVSVATKERSLVDRAWAFDRQEIQAMAETIDVSDQISVRCTYDNPSDTEVKFGMGTKDEMCAAFVYYWPAKSGGGMCGR